MAAGQSVEAKFRALVEGASIPMALFDRDLNVLAASGEWIAEHTGLRTTPFESGHDAAMPATLDAWRDAFRRGLAGETVHSGHGRHAPAAGAAAASRWSVQPWHDEDGAVAGILVMVDTWPRPAPGAGRFAPRGKDATPGPRREPASDPLADAVLLGGPCAPAEEAALKRARDRLRIQALVFHNAQEGIVVTNERCEIVEANPAFERITEYGLDEIRGRHMRFIQSGRHDKRFYQYMWDAILSTGGWQGEIWNRRKSGEIYLEWISISAVHDDAGRIVNFIGTSVDLSRINHAKSELERLAHHDALTGVPNRLFMMSRLKHAIERALRNKTHGAVLFVDLDGFKIVNDTHGHPVGDELLKRVAARLKSRLRDVDTVARLGGDEFVVILEEVSGARNAAAVAQAIIDHLGVPFEVAAEGETSIGASVGIALFPGDGVDPALIVQRADEALYLAKNAGRGTFRFF